VWGRATATGLMNVSSYRLGFGRRAANALVRVLLRLSVGPARTYLLTVPGQRSGAPRTTPVTLVEERGRRWLVAPYGEVAWVRNLRAAGKAALARGRRVEEIVVREVNADEAAPVLKMYVTRVPITRPYFDAKPESDLAAFRAEAPRHPVFAIVG
jgi:deazaflavin-dependent oxidoreductase (nitroreductase family)